MVKRVQIAVATILTIAVAAVFYYVVVDPAVNRPQAPVMPDYVEPVRVFYHPLTGIPLEAASDFFPVSVMYDNFQSVDAQPGLEFASIIYEALAEGGITRLMAVFDSSVPVERFGPIRSVRPYFIDWASEYGGVIMHVGGSPEALRLLDSTKTLVDINQIGANESLFTRDMNKEAPHNVFSSYSSWLKIRERYDVPTSTPPSWKFILGNVEPDHHEQQIEISYFPDNNIGWVYDTEKNVYVRFINGDRQVFTTGSQITARNVIIISVDAQIIDDIGRHRMDTLGAGDARIYRNGEQIAARWVKDSRTSRIRFLDSAQEEVALTPGVTWVQVVPSLESLRYSVFDE